MTDLDRSIRRVRTALLLFGVPCAAALTGLAFHTEVSPLLDIAPKMLRVIAAPTGFLTLISVMVGWRALRRTLRTQDEKLRGCIAELSPRNVPGVPVTQDAMTARPDPERTPPHRTAGWPGQRHPYRWRRTSRTHVDGVQKTYAILA